MFMANKCCKFPTFAVVLLFIGVIWLLNELNVFSIDIPWVPIVVIIIATGMLINNYRKK